MPFTDTHSKKVHPLETVNNVEGIKDIWLVRRHENTEYKTEYYSILCYRIQVTNAESRG